MDQATELAQTTAMATKVASTVMRVSGVSPIGDLLAPGRSTVGTTGRRGVVFIDGIASPQRASGLGRAAPHLAGVARWTAGRSTSRSTWSPHCRRATYSACQRLSGRQRPLVETVGVRTMVMTQPEGAKSVVVGIDGSQAALDAATWALDEAVSRGVPLRLV